MSESDSASETSLSLLDQLRANDSEQSWQLLEKIYRPLIRNWLSRSGVHWNDEDDLIQEVLIQVARLIPSFEPNNRTGAFRNWLRRVTINCMRNYCRKRSHRLEARGGTSFEAFLRQCEDLNSRLHRDWEEEHNRLVLQQVLEMARKRFQPRTWSAFVETALRGESAEASGRKLGMSRSAVHTARSRVLAAIREIGQDLLDEHR